MMEPLMIYCPDLGKDIDVGPYIDQALSDCPLQHDFSRMEVADLIVKTYASKYIPVDLLDRIENRDLWPLVFKVIFWIRSERRVAQLLDPDVRRLMPYVCLDTDIECCRQAANMMERWLELSELSRLPLNGCDKLKCWCKYSTYSRGDVEKRGVEPSVWYRKTK